MVCEAAVSGGGGEGAESVSHTEGGAGVGKKGDGVGEERDGLWGCVLE